MSTTREAVPVTVRRRLPSLTDSCLFAVLLVVLLLAWRGAPEPVRSLEQAAREAVARQLGEPAP